VTADTGPHPASANQGRGLVHRRFHADNLAKNLHSVNLLRQTDPDLQSHALKKNLVPGGLQTDLLKGLSDILRRFTVAGQPLRLRTQISIRLENRLQTWRI
jgi:hypothetical protein